MLSIVDINADAQEVVKGLGDRIAALSIEVEILRVAIEKLEQELQDERTASHGLAERLLKYVLDDKAKNIMSFDVHTNVDNIKP